MRAIVLALVLLSLAVAAGCGGDDNGDALDTTDTTEATDTTETTETGASGECESVDLPEAREPETREKPTEPLAEGTTYSLVFETNCGSFTVELDTELAPNTAPSLVKLAEEGYFDNTIFHRIVTNFVIQGGDPTQTQAGGPGYSTVDPPPANFQYMTGTVAMAKTGAEPIGTAGSQFFVLTTDESGLPAEYAVVGKVTKGIDVVELIGTLGDVLERPTQPVVISSVTVVES
jgi:cyclophilin family peptidyl-prolyl cis-trans isomerase